MTRVARIAYSHAELGWLEEHRMMVISDYHAAFCAAFGRTDVTASHLHGLRKRKAWKVGRAPGRYIGRHLLFSRAEINWLRDNCTKSREEYYSEFRAAFPESVATAQQVHALRKREGWKTGRTGHFEKGAAPWSKGKKLPFNANSARTQFKKGQQPHNTKFAGHERVRASDGYIEISVDETNPHTGFERRYVLKHRWLWEQEHGPVPEGMALKCKGNRRNTDPSNWELVPRAVLPRLNGKFGRGYDSAPAEIKPTIMTVAKLEHRIREKGRRGNDGSTSNVGKPSGMPPDCADYGNAKGAAE